MSAVSDRELLELAAKAAGKTRGEWDYDWLRDLGHQISRDMLWNPAANSGQALELAVKLRLHIKPGKHLGDGCTVETQRAGIAGCTTFYDDKDEQMRRAIVLAAAEIGKAMNAAETQCSSATPLSPA